MTCPFLSYPPFFTFLLTNMVHYHYMTAITYCFPFFSFLPHPLFGFPCRFCSLSLHLAVRYLLFYLSFALIHFFPFIPLHLAMTERCMYSKEMLKRSTVCSLNKVVPYAKILLYLSYCSVTLKEYCLASLYP